MKLGLFMEVGLLVQMGSLVKVCSLVEQVSLVKERIPSQWTQPAMTQYWFGGRLADTFNTQTDCCSCHDRCLDTPKHT